MQDRRQTGQPDSKRTQLAEMYPKESKLAKGTTQHSKQDYFGYTEQQPFTTKDLMASQMSEVSSYRPQDMQRKLDKEMHLLIDDLDLPNTSMTISNLSQSPWQGTKSTHSYLSGLTTSQRQTPHNDGESARNENLDSQNSKQELPKFIGSSLSSNEFADLKHVTVPKAINEPKRGGSPEFAKELTVTDDLTVSHTEEDAGDGTYHDQVYQDSLSQEAFRSKHLRNQNRTFADSVLNHHVAQFKAGHDLKGHTSVKRAVKSRYDASSANEKTDESAPYVDDLEREEGRPSTTIELDQISDLDQLLTQTQISNNLMKFGGRFSRSNITSADQNQLSRRTNLFKKFEDAESVSLTPDNGPLVEGDFTDSNGESNWFGQKSHITNPKSDTVETEPDPTKNQINPVNKLKARIKEQNNQMKKGQGPLSRAVRDQELEKALDFQLPVTIAEEDSTIQDSRAVDNLYTQMASLNDQVQQLRFENQRLQSELDKKHQPQSELLRARALEAARKEIRELQDTVEQQRSEIERLQRGYHSQEDQATKQREVLSNQVKSLELQLEKQKIIISSHKRDMENAQKLSTDATKTAESEVSRAKDEFDLKLKAYTAKIAILEKTLKQYETEYNQKADELDETNLLMEQRNKSFKELEQKFVEQQTELRTVKLKSQQLQDQLDQVAHKNKDTNELNAEAQLVAQQKRYSDFDLELQSLKQMHGKEVARLKEEHAKTKELWQQAKAKLQTIQDNENDKQKDDSYEVLLLLKERLGMSDEHDIDSMVSHLIEVKETGRLLEHELGQAALQIRMMSEQNKELKQALAEIEQRSNKNESQFSTQMMLAKDQEISGLSTKIAEKEAVIDKLKQEAIAKEDRLWDVEAELKVARSQFQNQANELVQTNTLLKEARKTPALLIQAVLALKIDRTNPQQTEQAAFEHLQAYQKQVMQQSMQETKKSMVLESDLVKAKQIHQDVQLEFDFLQKEHKRVLNLLNQIERKQTPQAEKETQCESIVSTQSTQTTLNIDALMQDNKSLTSQLSFITQQFNEQKSKHEQDAQESKLKRDLEQFKQQVQSELIDKTAKLDQACTEIESERKLIQLESQKYASNLIAEYESRLKSDRSELEQQLQAKQIEIEDLTAKLTEGQTIQNQKLSKDLAKAQVSFREKEREVKKLKEDIERLKKQHADAMQQLQDATEEQLKLKQEELKQKAKASKEKAVEKAVEKVRIDLKNQIDGLKNEHAKAKADWQRERKKLLSDHEEATTAIHQEVEASRDNEARQAKDRIEKQWKKRLEERERELEERIDQLERDRKDSNIVKDLNTDVCEQLQKEFTTELAKANIRHAQEITSLKEDFDRQLKQERSHNMPLQTTQRDDLQNLTADSQLLRSPVPNQKSAKLTETSYTCMCSELQQRRQEESDKYIEQLKHQFEQELNRQEALFDDKQRHQSLVSTKLMERLVLLECDKILHLINFKKSQSGPTPLSMADVNRSRNSINDVIKDILLQSQAMKPSFDKIKGKLSEVLASLKSQIEAKYLKQITELQAIKEREIQLKSISDATMVTEQPRKLIGFPTLANESVDCECHGNMRCRNCLSSPKFKKPHNESNVSNAHSHEFVPYLQPEQIRSFEGMDDEVIIRGSIQEMPEMDEEKTKAQALMNRLAPNMMNTKGAIVVEVEKVVRDLLMVHRTMKSAKFFRVLIGQATVQGIDVDNDTLLNEADQDKVVNTYRELLNHFFKVIVKLNSSIEELTQNNELYKLKLLNLDLKQQLTDLKTESKGVVTRQKVDDILGYFQRVRQRFELQHPTKDALDAMETLQFSISKHQFKLNQITDLFCVDGSINKDIEAVEFKCVEFAAQGGDGFLESTINVRKHPQIDQHNLSAELLSPDETANLIANIMQKMSKPQMNQTQQIAPQHLTSDVSLLTDNLTVTPQDLLRQALILCQNQSNNVSQMQTQYLSNHQQSTFSSNFTQTAAMVKPKLYSQMPLQMNGLPPKRQVTKSLEGIQRCRSHSSHSKQQQNFVTLPQNSADSNSQHSGYMPAQQSQSIDYQSQPVNPFTSIESVNKSYHLGMRPPNPKKPGTIASSRVANKNLPLQPGSKERYHTDTETTQQMVLPTWLNNA